MKTIKIYKKDLIFEDFNNFESKIIKENFEKFIEKNKKINYHQLFDNISMNANDLYLAGFPKENIIEGVEILIEQNIFNNVGSGFWQTLKERIIKWILLKLGIKGRLLQFLMVSLANIPNTEYKIFLSPLSNCEKITNYLSQGIIEWIAVEALQKMNFGGGVISDTIRNQISSYLLDDDFLKEFDEKMVPVICSKIRESLSSN